MVRLKLTPAVTTENLFSKHYLESPRLKNLPLWKEQAENERVFNEIKKLYEKEKSLLPTYDEEAQLEKNFIRPILEILGHTFEVQQPSDRSPLRPDYAFFSDGDSRIEAQKNKGKKEFYKKAIAIGEVKSWGKPLDRKSKGRDVYDFNNPSFQTGMYLIDTAVAWGILTNGKLWRLYYNSREKNPAESYYEVDLEAMLESSSKTTLSDFKYFYLFFRKEAFIRDASGKNFLDEVYSESVDYAQKVSEDLKKNVYDALEILARGFFAWKTNNLELTEENVKKIHENSLIFLYRILFILYADSRGMLKTSSVEEYDITKIKTVAFNKKQDGSASEHSPGIWNRLRELFKLIDEGSESRRIPKEKLYVPPYNGGLFQQDGEYGFLSEMSVGDKYVADVLEPLTFSKEGDSKGFIDYSTLEIRHLGSIYEGLLEHKLRMAEEDLVAVKEKDKQIWIPENKANGKKIIREAKKGELYLATDKGERKATGSYYTPDYIVKYIVENTLRPIVEEKLKGAATNEEKIERILSIKVLDPAMGSGHFLVEATNFLANKIVEFIPPEKVKEEKEIEWAKCEVVKRCIYGVDLNPLATELAKLSLWLATISEERPLSFLDHHLKVGNSLIGADLQKLSRHPTEIKVNTAPTFLSDFMDKDLQGKIETLADMQGTIMRMAQGTIQDIKNIEALFRQFENNPFRQAFVELANLHTSYWLSNKFSKEEYYNALEAFRQFSRDRSKWEKIKEEEYFKKAQQTAKEKNFFHWHLEFPDIFFGAENPGFDAVVGNPPYLSVKRGFLTDDTEFLNKKFITSSGQWDAYALFTEQSLNLLRKGGYWSFIIPKPVASNENMEPLRKYLLNNSWIKQAFDCGMPFKDAGVESLVLVVEAGTKGNKIMIDSLQNGEIIRKYGLELQGFKSNPFTIFSIGLSPAGNRIMQALKSRGEPLVNLLSLTRGIEAGKDAPCILFSSTPQTKPLLVGEDMDRFSSISNYFVIPDLSDETKFKPSSLYEQPVKLMIRRVAKSLIATVDTNKVYTLNTIYNAVIHCPESPFYLAALLNSKTLNWWFHNSFVFEDKLFPYARISQINHIPIRRISFATPQVEREKLVAEMKEYYAQGNSNKILSAVESFLPKDKEGNFIADKEKSDVVHDFLAFLAEQTIEINKVKQAEIKGFVSWLEREIGAKVEDLSNKTAIKEYYDIPFEDLISVLKKNKNKFAVDPSRREFQEKVKAEFESSVSKLKPLIQKIELTDKLIDRIVYKLYGLTEDELKIVEGAT